MKNAKGFTLVELLLALMLTAILFSGAAVLMTEGLRSYIFLSDRALTLQNVRYAMGRMSRELEVVAEGGVQNVSAARVAFVDGFGDSTDFNWNAQTQVLSRGSDKLLDRVLQFTVTAYRSDGATTTSATQTRRLRLQLQCRPAGQTVPITLETEVFLKNYLYEAYL